MAIKDLLSSFNIFEKTKRDLAKEIKDGEKLILDLGAKIRELESGTISKVDFIAAVERNIQTRRAVVLNESKEAFIHKLSTHDSGTGTQSMYDFCFSADGNHVWAGLTGCLPCFDFTKREEIMLLFHADSMLATARDIINSVPDKDWPKVANASASVTMNQIDAYRKTIEMTEKNLADIKAKAKSIGIYLTPRTAADDIDYEIRG